MVSISPALWRVLVTTRRTTVGRSSRRSCIVWVGIIGAHGTAWSPWTRTRTTNWTQRSLYLLFYKRLGVVDLLRRPTDSEQLEVGVTVRRWLTRDLYKCTSLLVDRLDILPASANYQA